MTGRSPDRPPGPFRVGLTGGIASGKTAVAAAFAALGVPVIDADQISRELVAPGEPLLGEIVAAFGAAILTPDGRLDRAALRSRIFADADARARLNALMHPAIRARLAERAASAAGPYVVLEIPLLVESGLAPRVDRVLVVDCAPALQRERLLARDGSSPAQADAILAAQASRTDRLAVADDVIRNEGSLAELGRTVASLHARYLVLAGFA